MGHCSVTELLSGESMLNDGGIEAGILTEPDIAGWGGYKNQKPKGTRFRVGVVQLIVVGCFRATSVAHSHRLVGSARVGRMGRLAKRCKAAVAHNPIIPLHRDRMPSASTVPAFSKFGLLASKPCLSWFSSGRHSYAKRWSGQCAFVLRSFYSVLFCT